MSIRRARRRAALQRFGDHRPPPAARVRSFLGRVRQRARRRWRIIAATSGALAVLAVYLLWPTDPWPRIGSVEAEGSVDVGAESIDTFSIVYRVELGGGGRIVTSTDVLTVVRPFNAIQGTFEGEPPGGEPIGSTVNAFARVRTGEATLAVAPSPASLDRDLVPALDELIETGRAEAREVRMVAGRLCQVFRVGGTAGGPSVPTLDEDPSSYSDLCLDEAGLILEEVTVSDGDRLTRRVADEVSFEHDVQTDPFDLGEPDADVRSGGGSVQEIAEGSKPPGTFWEPDEAPEGFEHTGRYAVIPPQVGFDDPRSAGRIIAFTSDVYERGRDVIVVEQGGTRGGTDAFRDDPNGDDVDLGELGEGQIVYGLSWTEVRALVGGGRFVRVFGTVEPSRLLALARSLEEGPGGDLVIVDDDQVPS